MERLRKMEHRGVWQLQQSIEKQYDSSYYTIQICFYFVFKNVTNDGYILIIQYF